MWRLGKNGSSVALSVGLLPCGSPAGKRFAAPLGTPAKIACFAACTTANGDCLSHRFKAAPRVNQERLPASAVLHLLIANQKKPISHGLTRIFTDAERKICSSARIREFRSEHRRRAFGHDENFVVDAVGARRGQQARGRFVKRFVPQTKTAVMHRHQFFRTQLEKRLH